MMAAAARACCLGALPLLVWAAPPDSPPAPPAPGRHAAQLCVATRNAAPPSCGPVQADLAADGALRLRIDDVVYHLRLHPGRQVEVVLTHGAVQIDEFIAPYTWVGSALTFSDAERNARYEIRFAEADLKPAASR